MTPHFLRSEAARFREMAESVTHREASRQRLLALAVDYDARAEQAEKLQPRRWQGPCVPSSPAWLAWPLVPCAFRFMRGEIRRQRAEGRPQ